MEENNQQQAPTPETPGGDAAQQPQYTAPQQQEQTQYAPTQQYTQYSQPAPSEYTYGQGSTPYQNTYQYGAQPVEQTPAQPGYQPAGEYQYQQTYEQPYQQQYQGAQYQGAQYPGAQGYPYPPTTSAGYSYVGQKSKVAAGLLGIFLGCFGAHNFYLGYTGKAVAQLLITILTLGFGSVITGIWSLIEAILILSSSTGSDWHRDAQGYELRD